LSKSRYEIRDQLPVYIILAFISYSKNALVNPRSQSLDPRYYTMNTTQIPEKMHNLCNPN
jgi:hypothetical protein